MRRIGKKLLRAGRKILPFCLIASIATAVVFFPRQEESEEEEKRVVRVWNVDTFEGGKGSRTAFLKSAAAVLEKEDDSVYYLVSSYTPEGAAAAYEEGIIPDALSFGWRCKNPQMPHDRQQETAQTPCGNVLH